MAWAVHLKPQKDGGYLHEYDRYAIFREMRRGELALIYCPSTRQLEERSIDNEILAEEPFPAEVLPEAAKKGYLMWFEEFYGLLNGTVELQSGADLGQAMDYLGAFARILGDDRPTIEKTRLELGIQEEQRRG